MSYIGQKPSETPGTYNRQSWLAAEGQTVFTFAYQPGFLDVWLNGSKLVPVTDFTATNGTSFTLLTAAILNDEVQAVSFGSYFVPGAYTQAQSDARYPLIIGTQASSSIISTAGGTDDAITGTYAPGITALTNGMTLYVRASSANATTTPTFTPNSGVIAAATIVKGNGLALAAGDIAGAGHWVELQYDATLGKWVLLNPATGIATVTTINDASFADNSAKPASTSWIRGAMSAIATAAGFAISLTANGYINFPSYLGGFIIQWGVTTLTGGASYTTVTLPIAYTTTNFGVYGNAVENVGGVSSEALEFGARGLTSFEAIVLSDVTPNNSKINWISVGY